MEKTKLLTWAVVGLLILNAGTLASLWLGRPRPSHLPMRGGEMRPNPGAFLVKELNFDDKQAAVFEGLKREHHEGMDSLQNLIRQQRETLFDGVAVSDTSKIAVIGALQAESERLTFAHFQQVRALCRPEQQGQFDHTIREVVRMMGNKGGAPPPPRD